MGFLLAAMKKCIVPLNWLLSMECNTFWGNFKENTEDSGQIMKTWLCIVFLRLSIPLKSIMIKIWIWVELSDFLRIKVSPTWSKPIILALFFYIADLLNDCFSNLVEKAPLQIWEYIYCIWEFFQCMHLFESPMWSLALIFS